MQFLFWKKLNRDQRKDVLVDIDVLPVGFVSSPVWLWHGLDAARQQEKLRELWGCTMKHLPDDQQERNPFCYRDCVIK